MDLTAPRQQAANRRQELTVQSLAEGIAAHDAARLDGHIDERWPGVLGELRQRSIDMGGGLAPHWLLESRERDRSVGALERRKQGLVGSGVRG